MQVNFYSASYVVGVVYIGIMLEELQIFKLWMTKIW